MEKRKLSASEIVENINLDYYQKEINQCEQMIRNIRLNLPLYTGIKGFEHNPGSVIMGTLAKDEEIARLASKIIHYREKINKQTQTLQKLNEAYREIDALAKEDILYRTFRMELLRNLSAPYADSQEQNLGVEAEKQTQKVFNKSLNRIGKGKTKINIKTYRLLKKNASKITLDFNQSAQNLIDSNSQNNNNLFSDVFIEFSNRYRNDLALLGVNEDLLSKAQITSAMVALDAGLDFYPFPGYSLPEISEHLRTLNEIKGAFPRLVSDHNYQNHYQSVLETFELLKNVKVLGLILEAFKKTDIASSTMYENLVQLLNSKKQLAYNMSEKCKNVYYTTELYDLVNAKTEVESLIKELHDKETEFANKNQPGMTSSEELTKLRDVIYKINLRVVWLLSKYPELNLPDYGYDLNMVEQVGKRFYDFRQMQTAPEMPEIMSSSVQKIEPDVTVAVIVPQDLIAHRTVAYSSYMYEKIMQSDLGQLKFSEYLEQTEPYLIELIKLEKQREERAAMIYKEYLKYLDEDPNRENKMDFVSFASLRYGFTADDIPYEYTGGLKR